MPGGTNVLIVRNDPAAVESDLANGLFSCPACGSGVLSRWSFARRRVLRDGQAFRPRRGICAMCRVTHVLLSDVCLVRRRDPAEVIGSALVAGESAENAAERAGVPLETVRSWRQRLRRMAEVIRAHFTRWLMVLAPGCPAPEPAGSPSSDALQAIGAAARAASLGLGPRPPWSWASALSGGRLLSNTSSPWPAPE
ncbi:MAG: transposase [Acidimicrobiales bacterium]